MPLTQSSDPSPLPRRLAAARAACGISQAKLGELAGLDPSVASARVNQYEQGRHEPKFQTVRLLASVLNVPTAFLYCENDEMADAILALAREREASAAKA